MTGVFCVCFVLGFSSYLFLAPSGQVHLILGKAIFVSLVPSVIFALFTSRSPFLLLTDLT